MGQRVGDIRALQASADLCKRSGVLGGIVARVSFLTASLYHSWLADTAPWGSRESSFRVLRSRPGASGPSHLHDHTGLGVLSPFTSARS